LAEHHHGRVAGRQEHDAEHDHGDPEEHRDHEQQASQDVLEHQIVSVMGVWAPGAPTKLLGARAERVCSARDRQALSSAQLALLTLYRRWWPAGCGVKTDTLSRQPLNSRVTLRKIQGASSAMISWASA